VQLVDLRRPRRPGEPALEVWASTGAELVRALGTLAIGLCEDFDVGEQRIAELRDQLGDELRDEVDAFSGQDGKNWLLLAALVARLEAPGSVEDLFALLEDDPALAWRFLVASHLEDEASEEGQGLAGRVLAGEAGVDEVRTRLDAIGEPHAGAVAWLLDREAGEVGAHVLSMLRRFHAAIGADMVAEALGPMERETTARVAERDGGTPIRKLVVTATNGYELGEGLSSERVLLLPSYWFRPWLIIARHERTEVFTTPIADQHIALPSQAPPPALVKLFKALGDEGRLRLLRRMASGPIGLTDAMEELDVAKTTAHHHLAILRQAGLVTVRDQGRSNSYALREDPPTAAADALAAYVGPVARTVLAAAD